MVSRNDTAPRQRALLWAALAIATVLAIALIAGTVVANYRALDSAPAVRGAGPAVPAAPRRHAAAAAPAPERVAATQPNRSDIEECNHYASSNHNGTKETVTDAVIGGAVGAGLGAAGGAIAGGGKGAGKGAAIGGLVGAAGGTLYGLNKSNQADAGAAQAYRDCMRNKGYAD